MTKKPVLPKFSSYKAQIILGLTVFITVVLAGYMLLPTSIFARNPLPENVDDYKRQVFDPAIASQDVNLQSTVYEIYLSLLSSMQRTMFCYSTQSGQSDCITPVEPPNPGSPQNQVAPVAQAQNFPNTVQSAGLIPAMMGFNNTFLSSPAVSSGEYIAYVGDQLNITSPAYAQGIGYEGLQPVLKVWQAFRNVAYLLATIGFLILSFMIMFRIRMSPQAVITAQSAIWKLFIVIVTITFSYAIAGFAVDLLFVFSYLIIYLFYSTRLITTDVPVVAENLFKLNPFESFSGLVGFWTPAGDAIDKMANAILGGVNLQWLNIFDIVGKAAGLLGSILISVAIIWALFRLLIQLLYAYLEIILLTVMAPIMILPDILPGGNSFMTWLRRIFASAMVFPTTTFLLLLGIVIVGNQQGDDKYGVGQGVAAGVSSGLQLPFLPFTSDVMLSFVGIGFILMTPKINDLVKEAFKAKGFSYMSAVGQAINAGAAGMNTFRREAPGMAMDAAEVHPGFRAARARARAKIGAFEKDQIESTINDTAPKVKAPNRMERWIGRK